MRLRAVLAFSLALTGAASSNAAASDLPPIKTTSNNVVPECVTPGRLMAFVKSRNASLDPKFDKIAVTYMRIGDELGIRWDYAFYQMTIETGYLSYTRDGRRRGDVSPTQYNFAGLGATGNKARGETFPDMESGVRAHLQHVLMYSGQTVEDAVAERTRTTQTWLVPLIQKSIKGPVTFEHLAQRWATGKSYAEAIETHAERFMDDFCRKPDPQPELVAEARPAKPKVEVAEKPGREIMRRVVEEERADLGPRPRQGLGAAQLARQGDPTRVEPPADTPAAPAAPSVAETEPAKPKTPAELTPIPLEEPVKPAEAPKAAERRKSAEKPKAEKPAEQPPYQTAAVAGLPKMSPAVPKAGAKCKVFTASYGGFKAILIQAPGSDGIAFTVLDVNEGSEQREAEAYIAAYAKGGEIAGRFANQTQALDKAFELCPGG